jgi:glycosyltransferase involved in cell wall biosynthesis
MGPFTVVRDALQYLSLNLSHQFEIVALVHRKNLFDIPNVTYMEFPAAKSSYLLRLYYELVSFKALSRKLNPYLWLSLHDITPNVKAERRAVYCHNPSPFLKLRWRDFILDPHGALYTKLYSCVYRHNIKKNDFVIVQQDWIRNEFERRYGVKNVIVAYPDMRIPPMPSQCCSEESDGIFRFFYPCFPRSFKNVETLLEAAQISERRGEADFEVLLTFDGSENRYARHLVKRYNNLRSVRFLGTMDRTEVFNRYAQANCVVFASKLETWGLPITEFKHFDKPLLVADLTYAHETVGSYSKAAFFDPTDAKCLARLMSAVMNGSLTFYPVKSSDVRVPFARGWDDLFSILLGYGVNSAGKDKV